MTREETNRLIERIRNATDAKEVSNLWRTVTTRGPITEVVRAHGQVSRELLEAVSEDR